MNNNYKELGEYLKSLRNKQGISLDILSERTKLSKSMLSLIETGKRKPSYKNLSKICMILRADRQKITDLILT